MTRAAEGACCDMCGRDREVATLVSATDSPDKADPGYSLTVNVCTYCAAQAIEAISGFRITRVLAQMYNARDNARNIRLLEQVQD